MKIREAQTFSDAVVEILKKERIRRGISQYKIAQACDISKSALSYIEKHERRPTLQTLSIIADYLGVKLSDIIKQAENEAIRED